MDYLRNVRVPDEIGSKMIQSHLRNVYATLTLTLGAASMGGYLSLVRHLSVGVTLIAAIADLILVLWLLSIPHSTETVRKRMLLLLGAGFCCGIGLGPLLTIAVAIKPALIITAVALTAIVFAGFTMAALFSAPGTYLHLGGVCMSGLFYLALGSLANLFFRSAIFFTIELYIGLAIFCGFVIYDTQAIVEKRKMGDTDFIAHAFDLFVDAIGIFRRILMLLMRREEQNNNRRRRRSE